jgi:hypothetical protein
VSYTVDYFNQLVLDEIESWPVDILADYARLVELLVEFGQHFVCRTAGRWEVGSSSFDLEDEKASAVRSTALWLDSGW